jgi:UDP-N-acetylmuramoyl-tripeptide--D-alanyl-D-alanine ligase
LGGRQNDLNREFGAQAADICDYVILVGPQQTAPIQEGLMNNGFSREKCFVAKDLPEAVNHLKAVVTGGDVVLFENDLPDMYN